MWRHFPHHSHAICGEISDFYTSVTRRNLKLLHMWRKFRFLHICHVERFEITLHVEKFQKSPHLSCIEIWNFSTWQFFSPQIYWWDWWQIWGMLQSFSVCIEAVMQKVSAANDQVLNFIVLKFFICANTYILKIQPTKIFLGSQHCFPPTRSTADQAGEAFAKPPENSKDNAKDNEDPAHNDEHKRKPVEAKITSILIWPMCWVVHPAVQTDKELRPCDQPKTSDDKSDDVIQGDASDLTKPASNAPALPAWSRTTPASPANASQQQSYKNQSDGENPSNDKIPRQHWLTRATAFFEHRAISLPRLSRMVQWGRMQGTNHNHSEANDAS